MGDPAIEALLAQVQASLALPVDAAPGTVDTAVFAAALARSWPHALTPEEQRGLEALCRKIAVAKRVWTAYSADWARPASREPLVPQHWPLLVAVLLAYPAEPASEADRGLALKHLNAAFAALDLFRDLSPSPLMGEGRGGGGASQATNALLTACANHAARRLDALLTAESAS